MRHQGIRWTYAELDAEVDRVARALMAAGLEPGDRMGIWAPNCAEWVLAQYASARAGVILVNVNPAYRTSELAFVLNQSGCRMLVAARSFKTSDYAAMVERGPAVVPAARAGRVPRLARLGRAGRARGGGRARGAARARGRAAVRRPDQPPVHERHDRLPEGRDALAPQHPQQRLLRRRGLRLHGGGPGLHPRALLPLLRHGHGQPGLHHARRVHGHPRAVVRARGDARRGPGGALHVALRRADDVHRGARPPRVRGLRPVEPAHRDHGRLALPGRGHAQGARPHAHARGDHLLRHDGDLAGVDADGRGRRRRAPHRHRRPRPSPRRDQGRRSR